MLNNITGEYIVPSEVRVHARVLREGIRFASRERPAAKRGLSLRYLRTRQYGLTEAVS